MQIIETKNEGLARDYEIRLTPAEIEDRVDKRVAELAQGASIKGFRPGKAPVHVAKTHYGERVRGEIIRTLLDESAKQAMDQSGLPPASQPQLEVVSFEKGEDLIAKLVMEVMPVIEMPDLKTLEIKRPQIEEDKKGIDEMLQRLADENRATTKAARTQTQAGDIVVFDFTGRIDGEIFEGGHAENYRLELGSHSFIPGFEEGLIGAEIGKAHEVAVTFPETYQQKTLAGKAAIFDCQVKEIHEKADAAIDEALAKKLGFDTLEKLREAVANQTQARHARVARQRMKTEVFDQLARQVDFEAPPSLYKAEYAVVARSLATQAAEGAHDHSHDHNHDGDHDHNHGDQNPAQNIDPDKITAPDETLTAAQKVEAHELCLRRVRLGLLLAEIGKANKIEVTEEDTKQAILEQTRQFPGQEQQVIAYYQNNQQAINDLAGPIFEERVMDHILAQATLTDQPMTIEALYAPEDALTSNAPSEPKSKSKSKSPPKLGTKKPAKSKSAKSAKSAAAS